VLGWILPGDDALLESGDKRCAEGERFFCHRCLVNLRDAIVYRSIYNFVHCCSKDQRRLGGVRTAPCASVGRSLVSGGPFAGAPFAALAPRRDRRRSSAQVNAQECLEDGHGYILW
jgi:hypothetical protein